MGQQIFSFQDLRVYQAMFALQQDIFCVSKTWPGEERFALTSQVRRSSRSVCANIAECWAKRRYHSHFVSKLTDADGELQESAHWLATALACDYITVEQQTDFQVRIEVIGKMLGRMISKPESFVPLSAR